MCNINNVYTAVEAAKLWRLSEGTVKRACLEGRFKPSEYRKSSGTWIVTKEGMERLYGAMPERPEKPA